MNRHGLDGTIGWYWARAIRPIEGSVATAETINRLLAEQQDELARLAEEVAETHGKIPAQGRYTADYRSGARDALYHLAKLIREYTKQVPND